MSSCIYDSRNDKLIAPCDTTKVSFSLTIKPIFQNNCVVCHSTADAAGGLDFESYDGARIPALDGRLVGAVKHLPGYIPMPEFE